MDLTNLNSFLKFGYFLDYKNSNYSFDFSNINKNKYKDFTEEKLINIGIKLWKNAIRNQFDEKEMNVVPLSGGLDSRAILATLSEITDPSKIYTYTFGSPGTWDFEIGNYIAKIFGTKHFSFDLTKIEYSLDELIDVSKRIDHQTVLFYHHPVWKVDELFSNGKIWSGAIIDVFFGRHYHNHKANGWQNAIINSFKENIFGGKIGLSNVPDSILLKYVDYIPELKEKLVLEHVIDLLNRQLKYIAPHVLMKGYEYKLLFTDNDLVNFANSVSNYLNEEQYLYKKMFISAFPKVFMLPTTGNHGAALTASSTVVKLTRLINKCRMGINSIIPIFINRRINYLDFNSGIRYRRDIHTIVYDSISDLDNRNIINWINIKKIWKQHIEKKGNFAKELLLLASLEIHLKAGKRI